MIVGTHGFLGIVRLVKVYDVVIFRGQGILAIRFLLGVVTEGDRNWRVDSHGREAQGECGLRTDRGHQAGRAIAQPMEKREQHAAPLGVSP